jgi:hypothetical protein
MQNRYVADIGDFGKYGLLRSLTGASATPPSGQRLRLGVAWYLHPDESHNADGKYTGYLNPTQSNRTRFRACDPDLYDALKLLVDANHRNVVGVRESRILPDNTTFHEDELSYARYLARAKRQATRHRWLESALEATVNADLVFVDPDNGISATADPLRKTGPKFVYAGDLNQFVQRGQSLVIYHHLGRQGTAEQQIERVSEYLRLNLGLPDVPEAIRYRRGTARAYFLIMQPTHRPTLEENLSSILRGPWQQHFQLVI